MASLKGLSSIIYHERQQSGSMLCAQHALNSLLQGSYFTAPDLSDIAHSLDVLEARYDGAQAGRISTNMDDTGFFSIQVLEDALNVWGLTLIRWRSETMRAYQDHPHTQLAFILNSQQHWFTLRRFGAAVQNPDADSGEGHWFNLNSFLDGPEWVGKLYLGMVLQQAEKDGYSVFAVTQVDPAAHLALPHTEADRFASTLPDPTPATPDPPPSSSDANTLPSPSSASIEGFEDEDMELQAALQASLMGAPSNGLLVHNTRHLPAHIHSNAINSILSTSASHSSQEASSMPSEDDDPVAASLARNSYIMNRIRQEQEIAQRELYEEEVARPGETRTPGQSSSHDGYGDAKEGGGEDIDDMDGDDPAQARPRFANGERVYDDDDAELQAALRASLKNVPEGFVLPNGPTLAGMSVPVMATTGEGSEVEEGDTFSEGDNKPSVDEIRRMRLARFEA